ncbi:SGNH/GDSL hydrolase family protein [Fumia xinanensis]|uniref:SGNH/GDSL hydrolase family protein n=1 Tax=Fumia xinanensis TaxID=2763659 RepID=A0A926E234_9FIRM|nr:SGNH/GDSL hydrolase family protein [Fumia xinanensis]MBC8558802.1 SGNH/GDSL hydrolase family protein [Fumia xinanensis]
MLLKRNDVILFQGDSITDWNRCVDDPLSDPMHLGKGYVYVAASMLMAQYPELNLKFYNRGISGNRSIDLVNRWDEDTIALKPDVLSLLIGVNDTWRRYDQNNPTTAEQYEQNCRNILERTKAALPDTKIVMIEPFLLHVSPEIESWREDLNPKILVARKLAREFADVYIPMDGYFAAASVQQKPSTWSGDGVHPAGPGIALIAQKWVEAVTK